MSAPTILAIDQGTTYTKALLVDSTTANVIASGTAPVTRTFPQPGWVESDPAHLWHGTLDAIAACLAGTSARVAAIAVTNQRESAIAWDRRTGTPLGPCISWQCRRTEHLCRDLTERGVAEEVRSRSGLPLDPSFSATKMRWLIDTADSDESLRRQGRLCVGTVDSWLLWNLTTGRTFGCDITNASRTQLMNVTTGEWDPHLLDLFGIPEACLPEIHACADHFGTSQLPEPLAGVPVTCLIGDSHAALYAQTRRHPDAVKVTYGTGSSIMTLTPELVRSGHGLTSSIGFADTQTHYALEGNINATGATVRWMRDLLGLHTDADLMNLASSVDCTDGVYVVPAFAGLGAPHWDPAARGIITGLTGGSSRAHLARAAVESIAFQVRDVLDALDDDLGARLPYVVVDGGASRNDQLMQFQADLLNRPVVRSPVAELSALGAAWLAGTITNTWTSADLAALAPASTRFDPRRDRDTFDGQYTAWIRAVRRARSTW